VARRISVEIVGNAASLERSFNRAGRSASGFHRDLNKATRGALSGSGVMSHLGRSLAFASGGFLAFATIGGALRSSIDAAIDAATTQRQLAAQLKASGLSYKSYRGEIDQTNLHLSALSGFTKDELDKSFTTIVRGSGNVGKALKYTALAADIARGSHKSLATVSLAVGKAAAGSTTSLRRLGLQFPKGTTGAEALAIAMIKFHGQARAGTTAQQRFAAVLHDSEVIIGTAILPTLTRYLTKGTLWLDQMNRSGRLQRDVKEASRKLATGVHVASSAIHGAVAAFRAINRVTGSTVHTLKAFAAVWLLLRVRTSLIRWGIIEAGLFRTGAAAATAEGEVSGLRLALMSLGGPGVLAALAAGAAAWGIYQSVRTKTYPGAKATVTNDANATSAGMYTYTRGGKYYEVPTGAKPGRGKEISKEQYDALRGTPDVSGDSNITGGRGQHGALRGRHTRRTATPTVRPPRGTSLQGRFNLAEYALAQAGMTKSDADDRRALATEAQITREQMAQAKTLKDKTKYAQQLAGITQQIQGIDESAASTAADKRKARAEKLRAAKEKASQFAIPLSLQLAQAKADAIAAGTGSQDMTKGQIAAAKAIRKAALRAIHSHRLSMQGLIDAWNEVSSINSQLQSQTDKGMKATYHHASTRAITAGLGLTHDQAVAVRERAAQAEAHRGQVPSGTAVLGQPITFNNAKINLHGVGGSIDQLASRLEKHARKKPRRGGR
jgi:hypothetical protein